MKPSYDVFSKRKGALMKTCLSVLMTALLVMGAGPLGFEEEADLGVGKQASDQQIASIEGTTWAGTDSDGDYFKYTFLKGGQLRFQSGTGQEAETYEDEGDYWAQNGAIVLMTMTKYATLQGKISGNQIQGDAWNIDGARWTWTVEKMK